MSFTFAATIVTVVCFLLLALPYFLKYDQFWIPVQRHQHIKLVVSSPHNSLLHTFQRQVILSLPFHLSIKRGDQILRFDPRRIWEYTIMDGNEEFFTPPEIPAGNEGYPLRPQTAHLTRLVPCLLSQKQCPNFMLSGP